MCKSVRNIMKRELKHLPITEQMYDYIFQHWKSNKEAFENRFIFIASTKEWDKLLEDDINWIPNKSYVYVKDDMTSILSRAMIFGDCPTPNYGIRLGQFYYYVFTFRATEKVTVNTKIENEVTGFVAWQKFQYQLHKYYSNEEIDEIIKANSTSDEQTAEIIHDTPFKLGMSHEVYESNKIFKLTNVRYYDINKAYASNLMNFFPKLKGWILHQYKVNKAYFKKVLNYTVGWMNHVWKIAKNNPDSKWHYLRNTIVTNTTNMMHEAMAKVNGLDSFVFYANTDGFMIANPSKELEHSNEIGDFGEEVVDNNVVWFTRIKRPDSNSYSILQYFENGEKVITSLGGFNQEDKLIDRIDLSQNKVVAFKTDTISLGLDDDGKERFKKVVKLDSIKDIQDYGRC